MGSEYGPYIPEGSLNRGPKTQGKSLVQGRGQFLAACF